MTNYDKWSKQSRAFAKDDLVYLDKNFSITAMKDDDASKELQEQNDGSWKIAIVPLKIVTLEKGGVLDTASTDKFSISRGKDETSSILSVVAR